MSEGGKEAVRADEDVVAASEVRRLTERVWGLAAGSWRSRSSRRRWISHIKRERRAASFFVRKLIKKVQNEAHKVSAISALGNNRVAPNGARWSFTKLHLAGKQ